MVHSGLKYKNKEEYSNFLKNANKEDPMRKLNDINSPYYIVNMQTKDRN